MRGEPGQHLLLARLLFRLRWWLIGTALGFAPWLLLLLAESAAGQVVNFVAVPFVFRDWTDNAPAASALYWVWLLTLLVMTARWRALFPAALAFLYGLVCFLTPAVRT